MSKGKISKSKEIALKNPMQPLNEDIFKKYGLTSKKFIKNRIVYRFHPNYIRGGNGEYMGYMGYGLYIQNNLNPIEYKFCDIINEEELRAIYKIINKTSIDNFKVA